MSHRSLFSFLIFLALASLGIAARRTGSPQASSHLTSAKSEAEIQAAIRQRLAALRREDAKAYVSFFAPDCLLTSDTGERIKPDEIAASWSRDNHSGISYHGSDVLDFSLHAYGDVAVASYRLELDEDWSGQKTLSSSRYTDVFMRRVNHWLLVAHQETPIPNLRRVAVRVDPSVYDSYAGEYELTPNYHVKVKREGDKLMDLWPGDTDYVEDVPVDQNTFVARGEPGEIIYVKGAEGNVTHFIFRTAGGDLIGKRKK